MAFTGNELHLFLAALPLAFFDLMALAALGAPLIGLAAEIRARAKGKVFHDKFGGQASAMAPAAWLLTLAATAASLYFGWKNFPQYERLITYPHSPLLHFAVAMGAALVLGLAYRYAWNPLKKNKGLHIVLGAAASGAVLAVLYLAVPAMGLLASVMTGKPSQEALFLTGFQDPTSPLFAPLLLVFLSMTLFYAGALALVFVLHRRNRDAFGRDYYTFALRHGSLWPLAALPLLIAGLTWLFAVLPPHLPSPLAGPALWWSIGWAACILACLVIWTILARSANPLRLKALVILSALLTWLAHSLATGLFIKFFLV